MNHLTMDQLLALRDQDRSEPGMALARVHFDECLHCQSELERLHQRTSRMRALPMLSPNTDEFPAVRVRVTADRRHRQHRRMASGMLAIAASLAVLLIGRDVVRPTKLDAEQQLQNEMTKSRVLEQQLRAAHPESSVLDGRTTMVVIELEDRIADVDAQLAAAAQQHATEQAQQELKLWQQRVGLMNALVDVHLTRASNVEQ